MRTLIELCALTKPQSSLVDFQLPRSSESPLRRLYHIVRDGTLDSDEEAMLLIYGKRSITAFSRLKARLREIFYQALIYANKHDLESQHAFEDSINQMKYTIASRILNNKKSFSLANDLLEKSLLKSMSLGMTENVLSQTRMLIAYNASISSDDFKASKYRFKKYVDLQDKYLHTLNWEIKAEKYFFDIQKSQSQSFSNVTSDLISKCLFYYTELKDVVDIDSFDFEYNRFRIHASYLEFVKDYKLLLGVSIEMLNRVKEIQVPLISIEYNIITRIIWAYIQSGNFEKANAFGSNLLSSLPRQSVIWFRIAYYTVKSRIYMEDYNASCQLLIEVFGSSYFAKLPEYYKELFNTIHGYLSLIFNPEDPSFNSDVKANFPEFKLGKYLNTTIVFSRDKRGSNTSILILFVATLLKKGDYNSLIDKIDSLNQYAYRYLRKDDSYRNNVFIKMIVQMAKADFNQIRIARYTSDLRERLSSVSLAGSGENIEIEVIPFESLWDLMLSFIQAENLRI